MNHSVLQTSTSLSPRMGLVESDSPQLGGTIEVLRLPLPVIHNNWIPTFLRKVKGRIAKPLFMGLNWLNNLLLLEKQFNYMKYDI